MPCELAVLNYFIEHGVIYGPAKAANAGGVATSGFEMSQNAMREQWTFDKVDAKLKETMERIFDSIFATAKKYGDPKNLLMGANIAGFEKLRTRCIVKGSDISHCLWKLRFTISS